MTIQKGTEIFSNTASTICYEEENFPTSLKELQTFYGDSDGASVAPTTKKYLSGMRIGVATEKAEMTVGGKKYQHLIAKTEERESGGLFGWGAGQYSERDAGVWVKVSDVISDKTEAEKLVYNRENAEKIAKEARDKALLEIGDNPDKNTLGNGNDQQNNTGTILLILGLLATLTAGLIFWKKKQKKNLAILAQRRASTQQPQKYKSITI